ncbi:MAG: hypothetical protein LRS49_01955 [Desulfurococcales archaeon]|nr:hypothetical protein [Desulfurococcales archaeon]
MASNRRGGRSRLLLAFFALAVVAASAAAALSSLGGGGRGEAESPDTSAPQAPPPGSAAPGGSNTSTTPGEAPRLGRVDVFSKVIAPPFVEARFLYKPFPLVVYARSQLDPSLFGVYALDSSSRLVRLEWEGPRLLGERNGLLVYQAMVELARGYYRPGTVELVVAYGGVGEPVNLSIMGPLNPPPLGYRASLSGGTVLVEVESNATVDLTVRLAYIANCGPGQEPAANITVPAGSSAYLRVGLPSGCGGLQPLTLAIVAVDPEGRAYYDYVPVPSG